MTGTIEERQQDLRRDSSGQLVGLTQGDSVQDIAALAGLLPTRGDMTVCFKARNRDGTYIADGQLKAPAGGPQAVLVAAPGFPTLLRTKQLERSDPRELAMLFHDGHCSEPRKVAYPAGFGSRTARLTATLNLGSLNGTPTAKLKRTPAGGPDDIPGTCAQLAGRSISFNVVCTFDLPAGFAGGEHLLSVDFKPARGPGNVSESAVWVAPYRP
jgi:hypothetical protein